jgi:signal transduction histidine kinase
LPDFDCCVFENEVPAESERLMPEEPRMKTVRRVSARGMRRVGKSREGASGRRRALVLAFLGVVAPLALLLTLQYFWLGDLERTSRLARQATLKNHVDFITEKIEFFYSRQAELALAVPNEVFAAGTERRIAEYLEKQCRCGRHTQSVSKIGWPADPTRGACLVFYSGFRGECETIHAYDPCSGLPAIKYSPSVYLATLYWRVLAKKLRKKTELPALFVDERDSVHPIILRLVKDEDGLLGVAGFVVDVDQFTQDLLPTVIHKSLGGLPEHEDLMVSVWDGAFRIRFGEKTARPENYELKRRFSFVFTDWTIGLRSRRSTSAEWARANFYFNVTLSSVVALVLLAGTAFAMRAAAREMKLSQMKNDFVSNVSHELRTPLSSIRVFGELMRLGRVQEHEKIRQYGEYIESEGRRLSRLIDNILDFSKIESGQRIYRFENEDLLPIVEDVVKTFAVRLRQGDFALHVEAPPEPLPMACVDAAALGHAIGNLIDNAIKYSDGGRRILARLSQEGEELRISVQDQGIGIAPEEHGRIFERFHRVGTSLVHNVKGSGLGLALVRHIMEAHGGRVSVVSAPGKGSEFTLHLPAGECGKRAERPGENG